MSEASWTPNPATERELAQVQKSGRVRRWLGWSLTLTTLGVCPFSCLAGPILSDGYSGQPALVATLGLVATFALGFVYLRRKENDRWLRAEREARLAADYGDGAGWLVTLHVYQGAALTGIDRGLLWFEDERLYFTGERTSFGLAANQVIGRARLGGWVSSLTSNLNLTLDARSVAGPVSIGVDVHEVGFDRMTHRSVESLGEAIRGWQSLAWKSGNGQIPPLSPGPEAPTASALLRRAASITAFWTVSILGLVALGLAQDWIVPLTLGAVGATFLILWGDIWMPRRHWQAWRDAKRLGATR